MKDRTVERGRGCWNCREFTTGDSVLEKFLNNMTREVTGAVGSGKRPAPATMSLLRQCETGIKQGRMGVCKKNDTRELSVGEKENGKPGTFISDGFLCSSWSGADGHSLATSGHALDKLPDELKDRLDG